MPSKRKNRKPTDAPPPASPPNITGLLMRDGGWTVNRDRMSVQAGDARIHQSQRSGGTAVLRLRTKLIASAPHGYNLADAINQVASDLQPAKPGVQYTGVELTSEQWKRITDLADVLLWGVGEPNTAGVPPPAEVRP